MRRYYIAAAVLIFIALAAGIANSLVSKPYVTDRIASEDLRALNSHILTYYNENKQLPDTLSQLDIKGDLQSRVVDYEYTPSPGMSSRESFTLCATFNTNTNDNRTKMLEPGYFDPSNHDKGRQCFTDYVSAYEAGSARPL